MTFARRITERQEQRAAQREANLQALCKPSRALSRGTYAGVTSGEAIEKREAATGGKAEQEHKAQLVALGCMACRRIHGPHEPGPVVLHHMRKDGWGKGDYLTLMPLCVDHHTGPSGVHGLGTKGFAAYYGFDQQDLLDDALALLNATPLTEDA